MEQTLVRKAPDVTNLSEFLQYYIGIGLTNVQASYVMVAENKRLLMADLEKIELQGQKILLDAPDTIEGLTESLANYRKICEEASTKRLAFSGFVEKNIIDPTMQPEKRLDYKKNEKYKEKDKRLLELRIKRDEAIEEANALESEKSRYLAHIKNENSDMATEFKTHAAAYINGQIALWLKDKVENPDKKIIYDYINKMEVRKANPFQRKLINDEMAKTLIAKWDSEKQFTRANSVDLRNQAIAYADQKLSLYSQDLAQVKARPEVIQQIENHAKTEISQIIDEGATAKQVNDLVASSSPMPVQTGKAVVTFYEVPMQDTREWASKVSATFFAHPELDSYLKVKEWKNLKVEQMANAIAAHASAKNIKFDGISYNALKK